MLQTRKNQVLTTAALKQMNVRDRELQFYMNSYWVWGSCCTVMEGFVFAQLVTPLPPATEMWLEVVYLVCIALCGGLNLYIITVTTLCCVWGPAMAIRGAEGLRSMHTACDFMKDEQNWVYVAFLVSICAYFGFSMCLISIYGLHQRITICCNTIFVILLCVLLVLVVQLERRVGSSMIFDHSGPEGRIRTLDILEDLADIDHNVHSRVPDFSPPHFPGMRGNLRRPLGDHLPGPPTARSHPPLSAVRHSAEHRAWQTVEHTPTAEDTSRRTHAQGLYTLQPGEEVAAAFARIGDATGEAGDEEPRRAVSEHPGQAPDDASGCGWLTRRPSPDG